MIVYTNNGSHIVFPHPARTCASRKKVPSYVALISGSSSSADIEFKLVIGVHGPKIAHYVVVKDY